MREITQIEARNRIAVLLAKEGHDGADREIRRDGSATALITAGLWADEANVYIDERRALKVTETRVTYVVKVSWPASLRTLGQCVVCLAHYTEATRLAAKIQALVDEFPDVVYQDDG